MIGVVWWTCALFTLVSGRIYDRCELARELYKYGIDPENIPTWVCIAYHESRLDTAANNPYSGDHGLFQISELYWCGLGKGCGVTCDKFRDEDITDDINCVLQIHEEHSRFQSNGFMAWVVYPQYCIHNAKKYVVDCDYQLKDTSANKLRFHYELDQLNQSRSFNRPQIKDSLPSYLAVSALFKEKYGRILDYNNAAPKSWANYKFDNIDELKLPVLEQFLVPKISSASPPSPTTITSTEKTTTTTYVPRIKTWRYIESNQFRKRIKPDKQIETITDINQTDENRKVDFIANTTLHPMTMEIITTPSVSSTETKIKTSTTKLPTSTISTIPTFTSKSVFTSTTDIKTSQTTTTVRTWPTWETRKPTIAISQSSSVSSPSSTPWALWNSWTNPPTQSATKTTLSPWDSWKSETNPTTPSTVLKTNTTWNAWSTSSNQNKVTTTTTLKPWTTSWSASWKSWTNPTTSSTLSKKNSTNWNAWSTSPNQMTATTTTTLKPWTTSWTWTTRPTPSTSNASVSSTSWTLRPWRTINNNSTITKKPYVPVTRSTVTRKTTTVSSQTINVQHTATNANLTVTSPAPFSTKSFVKFVEHSSTNKPLTSSIRSINPGTTASVSTTQSIFDLYLNPTRQPRVNSYNFPSHRNQIKIKIFSDGTTTSKPLGATGGVGKNQIRRQTISLC